MITIKKKLTLPEYRERKEIYETLGYKEVKVEEISDLKVRVTYEVDNDDPCYPTIRRLERKLYRQGPPFWPVILLVFIAFGLLSTFVVLLAKQGDKFDLLTNALAFLLPAFTVLALDVLYTFFYFSANKRILEESPLYKNDIASIVQRIRNK